MKISLKIFTILTLLQGINWARCKQENLPPIIYHSNEAIRLGLLELAYKYPHLAHYGVLGDSMNGQALAFVRIGAKNRPLLNPPVKYIGNMHGNEPVGRILLYILAHYLIYNYGTDDRITRLINSTEIWIVPTINPDGFDRGTEGHCEGADYEEGRFNENFQDLNRDFPTWEDYKETIRLKLPRGSKKLISHISRGKQRETRIMIRFIHSQPFVLSANFHDGAVLMNYPWDSYQDLPAEKRNGSHETPDNDVFYHVSRIYSESHPIMHKRQTCKKWGPFHKGITNGAGWYALLGGMQDFNYIFTNSFETTVEISCCKFPREKQLPREWKYNTESLIAYLEQAQLGIKGIVSEIDENGKELRVLKGAKVKVRIVGESWRAKDVYTSDRGEYWRLLLPGYAYEIQAFYGELQSKIIKIEETKSKENMPVRMDIKVC